MLTQGKTFSRRSVAFLVTAVLIADAVHRPMFPRDHKFVESAMNSHVSRPFPVLLEGVLGPGHQIESVGIWPVPLLVEHDSGPWVLDSRFRRSIASMR